MDSDERYRRLFRTALTIRLVEERIIELYPSDRIQSPVHLSIGQEGVAVGVCDALNPDDLVFATYRSHGFYIAKGGSLGKMFAELYGRLGGISKGKAGSMHLSAPEVGLMGSSAVVASTIPHAVGAALSFKRRGSSRVAVAVFGDGATEEGVYHESLNFAAVMKVPVLFICEDNGLAVHSFRNARQSYGLLQHAATFGIEARRVEAGWDMLAIRQATLEALSVVRAGRPFVLEIATGALQGACRRRRRFSLRVPERVRDRCVEGQGPVASRSAARRRTEARGRTGDRRSGRICRGKPVPGPRRIADRHHLGRI